MDDCIIVVNKDYNLIENLNKLLIINNINGTYNSGSLLDLKYIRFIKNEQVYYNEKSKKHCDDFNIKVNLIDNQLNINSSYFNSFDLYHFYQLKYINSKFYVNENDVATQKIKNKEIDQLKLKIELQNLLETKTKLGLDYKECENLIIHLKEELNSKKQKQVEEIKQIEENRNKIKQNLIILNKLLNELSIKIKDKTEKLLKIVTTLISNNINITEIYNLLCYTNYKTFFEVFDDIINFTSSEIVKKIEYLLDKKDQIEKYKDEYEKIEQKDGITLLRIFS